MATTEELITAELLDQEGMGETDADTVTLPFLPARRRAFRNLQREADFIWNYRNWPWKSAISPVPLTVAAADNFVNLPDTFVSIGPSGNVALVGANQPRLQWVPALTMNYLLTVEQRTGGVPNRYSTMRGSDGGNTAGLQRLYLYPIVTSDTDIVINFERRSPILADTGDPDSSAVDQIDAFPAQWHLPVLYEGLVLRMMKDKGSAQYRIQEELHAANVKLMVIAERPGRESSHRLVPYGMGGLGRGR